MKFSFPISFCNFYGFLFTFFTCSIFAEDLQVNFQPVYCEGVVRTLKFSEGEMIMGTCVCKNFKLDKEGYANLKFTASLSKKADTATPVITFTNLFKEKMVFEQNRIRFPVRFYDTKIKDITKGEYLVKFSFEDLNQNITGNCEYLFNIVPSSEFRIRNIGFLVPSLNGIRGNIFSVTDRILIGGMIGGEGFTDKIDVSFIVSLKKNDGSVSIIDEKTLQCLNDKPRLIMSSFWASCPGNYVLIVEATNKITNEKIKYEFPFFITDHPSELLPSTLVR
jgi:hypothetical protein